MYNFIYKLYDKLHHIYNKNFHDNINNYNCLNDNINNNNKTTNNVKNKELINVIDYSKNKNIVHSNRNRNRFDTVYYPDDIEIEVLSIKNKK